VLDLKAEINASGLSGQDVSSAAKELAGIMFSENYNAEEQSAIDQAEQATAEAEAALTANIRGD
jgi:hypothetical protein